jgi:steroid 5-alpha reductase family enzyme
MSPLVVATIVAACVAAAAWIVSLITHEHSWVDRIWSIVPIVYVWIFAGAGGLSPRLTIMAVLVTLWGARLTFNFARRGGYSGTEDYRWAILRDSMGRFRFELFNIGFIAGFQNALLLLITTPAYIAYTHRNTPLTVWDWVFALVFLAFLVLETTADQQQWNFQQRKAAAVRDGQLVSPGFVTTGLWRLSRHPNFFSEQAQWWVFYAIGVCAIGATGSLPFFGGVVNWTLIGPVLLSILFLGSTRFTESQSAAKYADYADYQRSTSMLIPLPPHGAAIDQPV